MITQPDLSRIARTLQANTFPSRFAVELCAECNLHCSMCHHPQMRRPKGVMPFPLWQKCADEIAAVAPATQVWFSFCGEPLLQPQLLLQCLAHGRKVGLQALCLNTNGMLLSKDLVDPLLDAGLAQFVIGLDAFRADSYRQIRCGGDRDVVYRNVEYLLERRAARATGPEVMVQFIAMQENDGELEPFRAHWLARGATGRTRDTLSGAALPLVMPGGLPGRGVGHLGCLVATRVIGWTSARLGGSMLPHLRGFPPWQPAALV